MEALLETIQRLRAEDGCPWDKAQTHESLMKYLREESAEVLEVLARAPYAGKDKDLEEELGDLLLQVLLHAQIASERGAFDFKSLAAKLNEKLIERHPHVFGGPRLSTEGEAQAMWDAQKPKKASSILGDIPKGLPACEVANRLQSKVSRFGFQWASKEACFQKVREEFLELEEAFHAFEREKPSRHLAEALREEGGDLLFILCSFLQVCGYRAEEVLVGANQKFVRRFRYLEVVGLGQTLPRDQLEALWLQAKALEEKRVIAVTGGIGTGKSAVLRLLKKEGFGTLSADQIAKDIREQDTETRAFLEKEFGSEERGKIRALCHIDPEKKTLLEAWMHPRIQARALQVMAAMKEERIAYEIPLFAETMTDTTLAPIWYEAVWVVEASQETRLARLKKRGLTEVEATGWMKLQASSQERAKWGTHFIENDGSPQKLSSVVASLLSFEKEKSETSNK
jgi:tetrapyrrole methylase family protein / MazG family protein